MKSKIKVKELDEIFKKHSVYSPDGELLGYVTEPQFDDIRLQISQNDLEGYYVLYAGKKYPISNYGVCDLPIDCFNESVDISQKIMELAFSKTIKEKYV